MSAKRERVTRCHQYLQNASHVRHSNGRSLRVVKWLNGGSERVWSNPEGAVRNLGEHERGVAGFSLVWSGCGDLLVRKFLTFWP